MENSERTCEICKNVFTNVIGWDNLIYMCKNCRPSPIIVHTGNLADLPRKTEPKTINENSYERVSDRITALSKYVRILQVELERVKSQIDLLSPLGEPLKNTTNDIDSDDISDCSNSLSDFGNDSDSDSDDDSDDDSDNESNATVCVGKREVVTKVYNINLNFN